MNSSSLSNKVSADDRNDKYRTPIAPGGPIYTLAVVLLFMGIGPGLMVLNKEILDGVDFRHPILVSSMGMVTAGLFTHTIKALGLLKLEYSSTVDMKFWMTRCLPVGICHAATLAFGNAQYLYTGMAAIQFLKSFTPIITACVTYALLSRKESNRSIGALVVLCVSTAAAVQGNSSLTFFGLMLAVAGSVAEAVRLVMTDFLLTGTKMQVLESMYYLAPAGGLCLFILGAFVEGPALLENNDGLKVVENPLMFFASAAMGVGVQLLTNTVIKATSATSLKVLSQVRNTLPVVYGALVYQEAITANAWIAYLASIVAFAYYTYTKTQPRATDSQCFENLFSSDRKVAASAELADVESLLQPDSKV